MSSRRTRWGADPCCSGQVRERARLRRREIHRQLPRRTRQPHGTDERGLTRRESLLKLGGLAAGALGAGVLLGDDAGAGDGPQADAAGLVARILASELTRGLRP